MVRIAPDAQQLTALEREALLRAIDSVKVDALRDALMRQVDAILVKSRTEKTCGYYADFEVPSNLRVDDLRDEFNENPPQIEARHPDGANAIFFVVYVKSGTLAFMEAASTSDWPENEELIVFAG
jgi:hypothetical protein